MLVMSMLKIAGVAHPHKDENTYLSTPAIFHIFKAASPHRQVSNLKKRV